MSDKVKLSVYELTVEKEIRDEYGRIIFCKGTSVPTGAGYAVGCIFLHSTTGHIYTNQGTTASASFNDVGAIAAAEITLANGKFLVGNVSGVGEAKTVTNANQTATNQNSTATNQAATATNQAATATNQNQTATNQNTTATNQATTATNQNNDSAKLIDLGSPAVIDLDSIVSVVNLTNTSLTVLGNPPTPRSLRITIIDTTPSITVGTVTADGTDGLDQTIQEVVDCAAGAGTYNTVRAFKTITGITTADFATLGGAGDETIKVGIGEKLGAAVDISDSYGIAFAGGVSELATVNPTYNTVIPTTALGGVAFKALVNVNHAHVQDSHNHTQDAHGHTQDAHGHTQDSHNHTQDSHNHTQDAHGHTQDAHTHTLATA